MSFVFVGVEHKAALSILIVVRNRMCEGKSRGATGYGVEAVFYQGQKLKSRQLQCETSKLGGRGTPGERHAPARGILGFGFVIWIWVWRCSMSMSDMGGWYAACVLCWDFNFKFNLNLKRSQCHVALARDIECPWKKKREEGGFA